MEINVKNCNNITTAKIVIEENKLNIKLAPNGTGKSTISKAIQFASSKEPLNNSKIWHNSPCNP
ncbi:hypothetical protein OQJ68_15565, partial [Microbulbifer thermotolerans]